MPLIPRVRLLCGGQDLSLSQTRCLVLCRSGYRAQSAMLSEAESLVRTQEFDLVIVSAWLNEWERGRILAAAGETTALVLTELTPAEELLTKVERRLQPARVMIVSISCTGLV